MNNFLSLLFREAALKSPLYERMHTLTYAYMQMPFAACAYLSRGCFKVWLQAYSKKKNKPT